MCPAGRARASDGARGDVVAWLCERAPLWVVVHVCALLRND
jgi:phage I-like protein